MTLDNRSRAQWREAFEQCQAHARKMRRENESLRARIAALTAVDPATRDEIADELAKHDWRDWKCSCGVAMEDLTNDVPHATYEDIHLADALAPLIARLRAEAADEALAAVEAEVETLRDLAGVYESPDAALVAYEDAARIVAARRTGGEG